MFIIYGKRNGTIKRHTYNQESCKSCKTFDIGIDVFKKYFHIFYIPFFPYGRNTALLTCISCGASVKNDELQRHYETTTKASVKYYAGLLILGALVLLFVYMGISGNKQKATFVAAPEPGDVYTIKLAESEFSIYYFIRVKEVKGDSVFSYHSNMEYHKFVSKLSKEDFFVKDEIMGLTKKDLKEMLDKGEITSAFRGYSSYKGFDRIK